MSGHDRVAIPAHVVERFEEYRYCKNIKPGLTHDEFLDEPVGTVAWELAIDNTVAEVNEAARRKAESQHRR